MRHALIVSGVVWVNSILSFAPVTAAFAAEPPPISTLFRQAMERTEHERGLTLPLIIHLDTPKTALLEVSPVRMTVVRDEAGLKIITAYRQEASDKDWRVSLSVLAAFIIPDTSAEERRDALEELQAATLKVGGSAKQIAGTWILASNNPQEGQVFTAYQIGVRVFDKVWDHPPPVWFKPSGRP